MKVRTVIKAFVVVFLMCATAVAQNKDKPRALLAPLPEAIKSAKTVVLKGDQQAIDSAFDELVKWGRFQVVNDKTKADLVFEFVYTKDPVADNRKFVTKETLEIHDAKSGESVYHDWIMDVSGSMARGLVKNLRKRLEQH
jgi:hypothetical protein